MTTTCWLALLPTAWVPKARLAGEAESLPVAVEVPVPANGIDSVGFVVSLLVIERLPVTLPAAVGLNVTVTFADCPAAIVAGVVMPLMAKSAPVRVRTEIVKLLAPVLDNTRVVVPFVPVETLPKSIEAGLTDNCGPPVALTAVAERLTSTGVLPLSPETVNVPVRFPAAVGVTPTLKLADWLGANAIGMVIPLTENCALETCAEVMFMDALPVFDTVIAWVACLPTVTLPKLTLAGLSWKDSVVWPEVFFAVTPAQPCSQSNAGIAKATTASF